MTSQKRHQTLPLLKKERCRGLDMRKATITLDEILSPKRRKNRSCR